MAQKAELNTKINLDSSGFTKGLNRTKSRVNQFANSAVASFARVGAAFVGINLIKNITQLGLAAGETASKFKSVFGVATDEMSEKIKELRKTIPSTTEEMQDALATFASMATAFGLNSKAANMFSVEMVKVAGDIASFHNLPIEEAFTKIRSAISGEFEPMKQLGIVINEARLKQEGLNLGIFNGVGAMNASQKALAVQSILIQDLGTANGDAAATAESAANKVKFFNKDLKETATTIGTTALPAIVQLTEGLAVILKGLGTFTDFAGTKVGELFYGPTDETLEKHRKQNELLHATKQARRELNAEGAFQRQGLFEMPIFSDSAKEKQLHNADILEKRIQEILEKKEKASVKVVAEIEKETEATGKLVEVETDPERKKSAKERLKAVQDLINSAGNLTGIETTLTEKQIEKIANEEEENNLKQKKLDLLKAEAAEDSAATIEARKQLDLEQSIQDILSSTNLSRSNAVKLAKELAAVDAGADTNQSGHVTPREQRAAEQKQRKEDQKRRSLERAERSNEVGQNQRDRNQEVSDRMTERERGMGIDTGQGVHGNLMPNAFGEPSPFVGQGMQGTPPTDGTGVGGKNAEDGKQQEQESEQIELLTKQTEHLDTIEKQLTKLDSALSGS